MSSARSPTVVIRPTSPLSPRFDLSISRSKRQSSPASPVRLNYQRSSSNRLALPNLPKFHPAKYPSATRTTQENNKENTGSAPLSPGMQKEIVKQTQNKLGEFIRDTMPRTPISQLDGPDCPKLQPSESPGPVTPFELDEVDNYLSVGQVMDGVVLTARASAIDPEELAGSLARTKEQRMLQHSRVNSTVNDAPTPPPIL